MDGAAKKFLMREFAVALGTLAGHPIGFELSRPLRQQAQRLLDGTGQLLLDLAQVLFGVLADHFQALIHVVEPGLDLGFRQLRFSQACRLCGGSGFGRSGIQDFLGQALAFGLRGGVGARRLTGLCPASLA